MYEMHRMRVSYIGLWCLTPLHCINIHVLCIAYYTDTDKDTMQTVLTTHLSIYI